MSSTRKSPPHAGLVAALTLLLVPSPAAPAAVPQQERTASPCESGVQTESVNFLHEDEKREGEGFLIIADRRIFAIMAFANAMGYDDESGREMHSVRVQVRSMLHERLADHPKQYREWKALYDKLGLPIFVYLDYALSLSPDYPFRRIRPDDELGYPQVANAMAGLPETLNDFWRILHLDEVWKTVNPTYVDELAKYDFDRMGYQLKFLWDYLRMERQDPFILVNVPDLTNTHFHGIGAQYGRYYYQVESPGSHSYGLNVHEYLHMIVNPLVQAAAPAFREKIQAYYERGKDGDLAANYQDPVTMAQECLIRALDHRLRVLLDESEVVAARVEVQVEKLTARGLVLTGPFFELLAGFEASDRDFEEYLPTLLRILPNPAGPRKAKLDPVVERVSPSPHSL